MYKSTLLITLALLFFSTFLFSKELTGDVHRQNIKQFLFSKKPIIAGKEDPAQFTTSFKATDKIYAIYYFDGGCADWGAEDKTLIDVYINGKPSKWLASVDMRPLIKDNLTYMPIEIIPDPDKAFQQSATHWAEKIFSQMKQGTNKISFSLWGGQKEITITGWNADAYASIKENAQKVAVAAKGNAAKNTTLPKDFKTFAKNPFGDKLLSEKNLKKYFQRGYGDYSEKVLKIAYPDSRGEEWYVEKDDFNYPIHLRTWNMGFLFKGHNGNCYYVYVPFIRPYLGAGRYGDPQVHTQGEGRSGIVQIDCANIN
jgi:hypothetical protein